MDKIERRLKSKKGSRPINSLPVLLPVTLLLLLFSIIGGTVLIGIKETYAESPIITINAGFQHCCYGLVYFDAKIQNPINNNTKMHVQVHDPDGHLIVDKDTGGYDGGLFSVQRQYVYRSYNITVIYANTTETKVLPPFSSEFTEPPVIMNMRAFGYSGYVSIDGNVAGGLEGEPVDITIYSPNNVLLKNATVPGNTKDQFSIVLDPSEVQSIFTQSGNYRIVATLLPTGSRGEIVFSYSMPPKAINQNQNSNSSQIEQQQAQSNNNSSTVSSSSSALTPSSPSPSPSSSKSLTTSSIINNPQSSGTTTGNTTTASTTPSESASSNNSNSKQQLQQKTSTSTATAITSRNGSSSTKTTITINGGIGSLAFINRQLYTVLGNRA